MGEEDEHRNDGHADIQRRLHQEQIERIPGIREIRIRWLEVFEKNRPRYNPQEEEECEAASTFG